MTASRAANDRLDVIYLLPESGGRFPDGSRVLLQASHQRRLSLASGLSGIVGGSSALLVRSGSAGLVSQSRSQRQSRQDRGMGKPVLFQRLALTCQGQTISPVSHVSDADVTPSRCSLGASAACTYTYQKHASLAVARAGLEDGSRLIYVYL